ncbi:MAG: hypothetical protein HY533_02020 [Chloroflexi bacterium]|nr:hypothetical protein [Chloroflexota bacterium]
MEELRTQTVVEVSADGEQGSGEGEPAFQADPGEEQGTLPQEGRVRSLEEALAALEERATELAGLRASLSQRDVELTGLRGQLAAAASKYREALVAAAPEVPAELITGVTPEEMDASLSTARQMVERIRSQAQPQANALRVPAGAPVRSAPDPLGLSAQEKIALALAQRR